VTVPQSAATLMWLEGVAGVDGFK